MLEAVQLPVRRHVVHFNAFPLSASPPFRPRLLTAPPRSLAPLTTTNTTNTTILQAGRPMLVRHGQFAFYRPSAVSISRAIIDIPFLTLQCVLSSIIIYFLSNLRVNAGAFFIFLVSTAESHHHHDDDVAARRRKGRRSTRTEVADPASYLSTSPLTHSTVLDTTTTITTAFITTTANTIMPTTTPTHIKTFTRRRRSTPSFAPTT